MWAHPASSEGFSLLPSCYFVITFSRGEECSVTTWQRLKTKKKLEKFRAEFQGLLLMA
jgi:hypothetical protein